MSHDLAIIGSGSAASAAAIRARDSGKSVVMIERGTTGGTCVKRGLHPEQGVDRSGQSKLAERKRPLPRHHHECGAGRDPGPYLTEASRTSQTHNLCYRA